MPRWCRDLKLRVLVCTIRTIILPFRGGDPGSNPGRGASLPVHKQQFINDFLVNNSVAADAGPFLLDGIGHQLSLMINDTLRIASMSKTGGVQDLVDFYRGMSAAADVKSGSAMPLCF